MPGPLFTTADLKPNALVAGAEYDGRPQEAVRDAVVYKAAFKELADQIALKSYGSRQMGRFSMPTYGYGSNVPWTTSRTEQVKHFTGWVYVAIKIMCEIVGGMHPKVSKSNEDTSPQSSRRRDRIQQKVFDRWKRKSWTFLKEGSDLEPVEPGHPLMRLLRDPNGPDVAFKFWYELIMYLQLTGNVYIWCPENAFGLPQEMWVVPSHWVVAQGGPDGEMQGYMIRPLMGSTSNVVLPAEEVIHIMWPSPISKLDGWSPLFAGARWIDTSESIDIAHVAGFKNGAFPSFAIELDKDNLDPSQEDVDRITNKFLAKFQGETKYGKPIVMSPGTTLVPLSINPQEMGYVQSAEAMRDHVLNLFRIPKALIDPEATTFGATAAALANFCTLTLKPIFTYIGQILTEKLAHRFAPNLVVWWEDPSYDDPQQDMQEMQFLFQCGAITPNELRQASNLEPYEHGGDDPILNGQPVPWATGKQPEPPPGQGGPPGAPPSDGGGEAAAAEPAPEEGKGVEMDKSAMGGDGGDGGDGSWSLTMPDGLVTTDGRGRPLLPSSRWPDRGADPSPIVASKPWQGNGHVKRNAFVSRIKSVRDATGKLHDADGRFAAEANGVHPEVAAAAEKHDPAHKEAQGKARAILKRFSGLLDKMTDVPVLRQLKACGAATSKATKKLYAGLEKRYGRKTAIAIMASAQVIGWGALGVGAMVGVPLYLPGVSLWGSIPAAALAETYLQAMKGAKALSSVFKSLDVPLSEAEIGMLATELIADVEEAFGGWLREHEEELADLGKPRAKGMSPLLLKEWVTKSTDANGAEHDERGRFAGKGRVKQTETEAFKRWFGDSKVVDGEGKPLVVYHGTANNILFFDDSMSGKTTGEGVVGHWFTASSKGAEKYAGFAAMGSAKPNAGENILPVYLALKNPKVIHVGSDELSSVKVHHSQRAKEEGYDGLIVHGSGEAGNGFDKPTIYVVFSPSQIKSATGNAGTFDASSPDITKEWKPEDHPKGEDGRFVEAGHEGESGGKAGLAEKIKARVLAAAADVDFTDHAVKGEKVDRHHRDIEEAMTDEEKEEMEKELRRIKKINIDEQMSNHEDDFDATDEAAQDVDYEQEDIREKMLELIDEIEEFGDDIEDDDEERDRLKEMVEKWKFRRGGPDAGRAMYHLMSDEVPAETLKEFDDWTDEKESEFKEAVESLEESHLEEVREEYESGYDDTDERNEYLYDFYDDNEDRFSGETELDTWGKDSDGDHEMVFETSAGNRYEMGIYGGPEIPGLGRTQDFVFSDASGSFAVTGAGGAHEVFGKVTAGVVAWAIKHDPESLSFTAREESRQKLYDKLVKTITRVLPEYSAVAFTQASLPKRYLIVKRDKRDDVVAAIEQQMQDKNIPGKLDVLVKHLKPELALDWLIPVTKAWDASREAAAHRGTDGRFGGDGAEEKAIAKIQSLIEKGGYSAHDGLASTPFKQTDERPWADAPSGLKPSLVEIPIKDLETSQHHLKVSNLVHFIRGGMADPSDRAEPKVWRTKTGKLVIEDGNHELAAMKLLGKTSMTVRLLDLNNVAKSWRDQPRAADGRFGTDARPSVTDMLARINALKRPGSPAMTDEDRDALMADLAAMPLREQREIARVYRLGVPRTSSAVAGAIAHQIAEQTRRSEIPNVSAQSAPVSVAPDGVPGDGTPSHDAIVLSAVQRLSHPYNLVSLADLRDDLALQGVASREEQDAVLARLRSAGRVTLIGNEGRHGLTERDVAAAIPQTEYQGQASLGFVAMRKGAVSPLVAKEWVTA